MDDGNNQDKSESTDENEERSETETECFDKTDSDIISQSESSLELRCIECNINFQSYDDFQKHKIHRHPIIMYKCGVDNCQRWFSSRKSRDKHSENLKSQLHKSQVKSPPVNAIFIENASQEELEILKVFSSENIRSKNKRGPRPRETDFLIGLPRDQLKRKLMESVVEKMESNPNKKNQEMSSTKSVKKQSLSGQLSMPSDSKFTSNKVPTKSLECKNTFHTESSQKLRSIPDFSHIKVPVLSLDSSYSLEKFSEELINLLVHCDPAEIFKYPLIDYFAPLSSRLTNQIDMKSVQKRLKEGMYSKNLEILENDLLLQYSNGIQSFDEKSKGWYEAAKLYQTALVNIRIAKKIFDSSININDLTSKNDTLSNSQVVNADNISTVLNLINPYNNGKINDNERIMTIGDQIGKLKSGNYHLSGYKEDRRNKVTVLSYLDYGTNFSFGPSYDSGNSYCSKETSDLLIRAYGDRNYVEEYQCGEINEIIPENILGDDFSIYLMNIFTKDVVKSFSFNEDDDKLISVKQYKELNGILNTNIEEMPSLQTLLDESWKDLARLKSFNYQRLSNYQLQPSCDEQSVSEKVTSNLINLIIKTNPESITNLKMIRKALNCK